MEKKTIEEYPLKRVIKRVECFKPIRNDKGAFRYKDALQYLARVLPQNDPSYGFILGLASFATANQLSNKQREKADEFIEFYESKGVL